MKQHEREYFVSQIRAGIVYVVEDEITLKVFNPTIEQQLESSFVFDQAYSDAYRDEVMSQDDMMEWMLGQGAWSKEKDDRIEGLKKDVERCQIEIFNARNNKDRAEHIRKYIRAGEKQLIELLSQQLEYYNNTLEGIATTAKDHWLIEHCTFLDGQPYDFSEIAVTYVHSSYRETLLQGGEIRELVRSEPWKSLWMTRNDTGCDLFFDAKSRILNDNQKNLVVWSQMYDNIQESMDCPSEDVINDDDMLDGWFIVQGKKRDKERAEGEFEDSTKSEKIRNSDEVFVMAGSQADVGRIESMNDIGGKMTIKQREATMRSNQGKSVTQNEFTDEKVKLQNQRNQQYKSKFGGG
jgi:hypothetical protein